MDIVMLLLVPAVIGLVCWVLITYVPLPPPFPMVVVGIGAIVTVIWLIEHLPLPPMRIH